MSTQVESPYNYRSVKFCVPEVQQWRRQEAAAAV